MVVGVFPIAKLGALFLRQVSKPIANFAKERAKHNYFFRTYVCMPPAQFYNWCEVRIKMWVMNMGKPDTIPPLNEQMAIELGANLLGESIVFVVAAGVIVLEYSRQLRKEATKEAARQEEIDDLNNRIRDLCIYVETHHAQIRRLEHSIAEIDSKTIRIPWKGGSKPPTEEIPIKPILECKDPVKPASVDKQDNVTKEAAPKANLVGKEDNVKKDDEKKRVSDTIFTNVAMTSDGGIYWEGLEKDTPEDLKITDWHGKEWTRGSKTPSSHPNSRFCAPCENCPIMDPAWEDPEGVPIDAILFGGRRPEGIPLVYESLNWSHGVYMGASMRSEATAAAEHTGKVIMHDPFAMRPFFGYNFGYYLRHWLDIGKKANAKLPKIYHVNWFKKDEQGNFLWPGYGENSRVLDWIFRRLDGEKSIDEKTPIGIVPAQKALNLNGLSQSIDHKQLFDIDYDFWKKECDDVMKYLEDQTQNDLPSEIKQEIENIRARLEERKNQN